MRKKQIVTCFVLNASPENAKWEKNTWAVKLSALFTGRAMNTQGCLLEILTTTTRKRTRYNFT